MVLYHRYGGLARGRRLLKHGFDSYTIGSGFLVDRGGVRFLHVRDHNFSDIGGLDFFRFCAMQAYKLIRVEGLLVISLQACKLISWGVGKLVSL
jgi:hypothetical protein